jgi:hypothetical protein
MNSSEFDRRFEEGESVIDSLGLSAARRPRLEQRRVNVDFRRRPHMPVDLEYNVYVVLPGSTAFVTAGWFSRGRDRQDQPLPDSLTAAATGSGRTQWSSIRSS